MVKVALPLLCILFIISNADAQRPRKRPAPTQKEDPYERLLDDLPGWRLAARGATDKNGRSSNMYYDRARITRKAGGIVRLWVKFVEAKYGVDTKEHTIGLIEIDCTEGRARTLAKTEYDEDGNPIPLPTRKPGDWEYITPDTLFEALHGIVCKGEKDLQQITHDNAENCYSYGLEAERRGDYKSALNWYETGLILEDSYKLRAARDRVKAKVPTYPKPIEVPPL